MARATPKAAPLPHEWLELVDVKAERGDERRALLEVSGRELQKRQRLEDHLTHPAHGPIPPPAASRPGAPLQAPSSRAHSKPAGLGSGPGRVSAREGPGVRS